MRTLIIFTFLITIYYQKLHAQNLVPNPSFEDTLFCPVALTQILAASGWQSYRISPDLYHSCSTTGTNMPNAIFGYQIAHSGVAMAALLTYRIPTSPDGPNTREFMGCMLSAPLIPGIQYYVSFYANFSYHPLISIASNNIGIKLSTVSYSATIPAPIDNQSQLNYPSIITDSLDWTKVSGSFIADSAYNYLIVGNFYTDQNTDTLILGNFADVAYYYIDDICLSTDSNYCETWTINSPQNIIKEKLKIFPNPFQDQLLFETSNSGERCSIYNLYGELLLETTKTSEIFSVNLSYIPKGMYILKIYHQHHTIYRSIIKN